MDQKKTRALCVGKVNIFVVYNDSYKEEIGKNVLSYKVVSGKYKIICKVLLFLVLDYRVFHSSLGFLFLSLSSHLETSNTI